MPNEPTPSPDDDEPDRALSSYPAPDITPAEFEGFVKDLFESAGPGIDSYEVRLHDVIAGSDGSYDFDAAVRFSTLGVNFVIVIEAKRHKNAIKRELVQVLQQKKESVGAHKAILISTAKFQRGAIRFALAHGIALARVVEGRATYETKSLEPTALLPRDVAKELGFADYVAVVCNAGAQPGSISSTIVTLESPDRTREELLGLPERRVGA
jgi:hypothetical protein